MAFFLRKENCITFGLKSIELTPPLNKLGQLRGSLQRLKAKFSILLKKWKQTIKKNLYIS